MKALAEAGDPEAIAERDAMLAKDAEARERKKKRYAERMANDPEYAEKIRQRQRAYNKAHADKRKADYADLIKRTETDPEAARELAEIRGLPQPENGRVLLTKKKAAYPDYHKARNEMQELVRVQKNVERFFSEDRPAQENEQAR